MLQGGAKRRFLEAKFERKFDPRLILALTGFLKSSRIGWPFVDKSGPPVVLRGNCPTKIDGKFRLKIPTAFRTLIEQQYGTDVYLTSLTGEYVRIYPMPVWEDIERRLQAAASLDPARAHFLMMASYFGQHASIDRQGRVVIHQRLRESAETSGEVDVLGQVNYLEIWNHERLLAKLQSHPFTDDDARELARLGI